MKKWKGGFLHERDCCKKSAPVYKRLPLSVCLSVGATDTENSIIDVEKCLGCGVCARACPSGAISMVPAEYPPQQKKTEAVTGPSFALAEGKAWQEKIALQLAETAETDGLYRLMTAICKIGPPGK